MKKLFSVVIILSLCLNLSACATIYRGTTGTTKEISIRTEPEGANILFDGQSVASPAILQLAKNRPHKIIISKEGYKTVNIKVNSKVKPGGVASSFLSNTGAWGWWTLGIGTAIGMIVDTTSGSLKDINIESASIALTPGEGEINIDSNELNNTNSKN